MTYIIREAEQNSGSQSSSTNLIRDQQENSRREREASRIAALPVEEQEAAIELEIRKQQGFDDAEHSTGRFLDSKLPRITDSGGSFHVS